MRDYREKPSAHLQASPNHKNVIARNYHIILAGNFRWGSIFTDDQSYHFAGLILMDACTHTHYNRAYFVGLIFAVTPGAVKTVKIGPLENFPLHGI